MSNHYQAQAIAEDREAQEEGSTNADDDSSWLQVCRDAYRSSTDYLEASLKKQWERNMSHFRSRHAPGSKYYTDNYKYRSKIFRPKTRSAVRKHEAAAAAAYFATEDAVHIKPEDDANPEQLISAEINTSLLNYRLEHSIPWFQTLIGAYQETMVIGAVVSYQHWLYKEKTVKASMGMSVVNEAGDQEETVVLEDRPVCDLRPIENIRLDPASDWADPINTSPYLIDMIPMYVIDVRARMEVGENKTGEPEWTKLTDDQIISASKYSYDSLRQEREGTDRRDSKENYESITDYKIVWVHRNFIKKDDEHVVFYTMGTEFMLSEPKPIEEVYRRKTRPYVMGVCQIETHRNYPSAMVELGEQIQNEANEIANVRLDNVKLAVNQRHYIRRGADIDYTALMRSAPGSGILMEDINQDIKPEEIGDVTSSSYEEQDRLNGDFDDIIGGFSGGSVASNRKLGETLGGLEMLSGDANKIEEYQLRVFNETFTEPVLNQILDMEKEYESDETIIAIAGKNSKTAKENGIQDFNWRMLQAPMTLRVAVGFGATNPQKRIEKLSIATRTVGEFMPDMIQSLDKEEFVKEIFGAVGMDGGRFFTGLNDEDQEDPQIAQLKQQMQEMQQIIEQKQVEQQGKVEIEGIKQQGKLEIERIKSELAMIDKRLAAETNELARGELMLEQSALMHAQQVTEIQLLQDERGDVRDEIDRVSATLEQTGEDDSKAGLLERNNYGSIPFAEG